MKRIIARALALLAGLAIATAAAMAVAQAADAPDACPQGQGASTNQCGPLPGD